MLRPPPVPPLLIRDIRADDKAILAEGLARLSPRSVHARFLAAKPRFTGRELRYLTEVDGFRHVALVAFDPDGHLVAVARSVSDPLAPGSAEVAIVVADHLQGRGIGTRLGLALADRARAGGVVRFTAVMLPDNHAAHALFARISGRLAVSRYHDGVREVVADLRAA